MFGYDVAITMDQDGDIEAKDDPIHQSSTE
jgi:hypothetical protein